MTGIYIKLSHTNERALQLGKRVSENVCFCNFFFVSQIPDQISLQLEKQTKLQQE